MYSVSAKIERADERHGNPPPQGNQDLLVVRDKVGRPSDELEVNRCLKCDIFCSFLCSMVGRQEGHPACKTFGVGLLMALI